MEFFRLHNGPTLKAFEALNGNAEALSSDLVALARRFDQNGREPVAVRSEYVEVPAVKADPPQLVVGARVDVGLLRSGPSA